MGALAAEAHASNVKVNALERISMNFAVSLRCRSGNLVDFAVRVEAEEGDRVQWHVYVLPVAASDMAAGFYYASLLELSPDLVQLLMVTNDLPDEYQGCGITTALIPELRARLGRRVRSSLSAPTSGTPALIHGHVDERSGAAELVWRRLRASGAVRYDAVEDRYYCE